MKMPPAISDAEWKVMEVLWERGPSGSQEVIEALAGERAWKPNTVRTLLGRLVKKGAIAAGGETARYVYRPKFTREQYVAEESESFLERVFQGSAAPLLLHFAGRMRLSRRKIEELRRILEEK